ncbi:hypothetical protein MUK70_15565 [Dyadobacter chenwenxiniae]|uniref:Uncharacterized protein n=1 Tax=Dyadobacter chenwenxiniae TaxID=2906456 RepID=A0A9X1PIN1_9BACT|nr:hypothetical protein [Dyadobacter chenwenxiniae]MCF0060659.1 hypothetical protein [Dyadobacter chenwenxiniae]UON80493.1 hypothetical protein MUK70_15565 [Dyadobacter chenwenxiniae]
MNRSHWYILINTMLFLFGSISFYYATPKFRKSNQTKLISQEKESEFRKEVIVLDSLYKQHVNALISNDQIAIASTDAILEKQFTWMKKEYAGQTSPALLASKLIRNYQVRVLLNKHLISKRNEQAGEVKRVSALVAKLEEQNTELKSQNQMIKQVLLGLP